MRKKMKKKFFVFEILLAEYVALNCLYEEENTCNRHSVCSERVLRFYISLTETFCKTIAFPGIIKNGKGAVLQI